MSVRPATHAGSWYDANPQKLRKQVSMYMEGVANSMGGRLKALIGPHAGFAYSAPTAGRAYALLDQTLKEHGASIKRIFVMGPSHRKWIDGIEVSSYDVYDNPLGQMSVDRDAIKAIERGGKELGVGVGTMSQRTENQEHSLELHMPFLAHVINERAPHVKIVPMIVGSIDNRTEQVFGQIFGPFYDDKSSLFVVSSDFCHWGERFDYQYQYKPQGTTARTIGDGIEAMDREGMSHIEAKDIEGWSAYLSKTGNTICGRHPISVLLHADRRSKVPTTASFVGYDQSSRCATAADSSVSYAAGVFMESGI